MEVEEMLEITPLAKLNISISEDVLKRMKEAKININQLFILSALYNEGTNLLDIYDDNRKNQEVLILDYQDLIIHGFLSEADIKMYNLTERGHSLIQELEILMKVEQAKPEEVKSDIRKLSQQYLDLFPRVKLPSNQYARASVIEIEKKLSSWLKINKPMFKVEYNHVLKDEDILTATKNYVDRYAKTGYRFMKTSAYFIKKDNSSALTDELIALIQGVDKEDNINKFEKQL